MEQLEPRTLLDATTGVTPTLAGPAGIDVAHAPENPNEVAPYLLPQRFLAREGALLSAPRKGKAADVAKRYLVDHAADFGLTGGDLSGMRVTDRYTDADTGVTHVYFRQRANGLDVANTSLSVHLTRDNAVIAAGGGFVAGAVRAAGATLKPTKAKRDPAAAVDDAAAAVGIPAGSEPKVVKRQDHVSRPHVLRAPWASKDDVPARLQYLATEAGLTLVWNVVLRTPDGDHWYDANVDAATGTVVSADDWVEHATYNVYPAPGEGPNDAAPYGSRATVTDPHDPVASPFGWHDTDGVAGAEFTDTRGNNVSAQEDANADDAGGARPSGGTGLAFDHPLDLAQSPAAYQSAAVDNLFYWNNLLHDVHARYGFTEAAGNFQTKNYSGQGLGNDAVQADAQDGSGTNNANFATPADGQQPRMQMYLFNYTSPGRDGDLDNQIIVHEYGHGVSNRLTGGPSNASALTATQSGGMGEGWSDWWGLMLTMKASDLKTDSYPVGTYVLGQSRTTGAGIRRYPYAFDLAKDPLTFAHYNSDSSKEVHNTGEIWCSALWDMTWLLVDKYGFSPTINQGYDPAVAGRNGGNNLALKLVMDGLKLQPANPTFVQARDAILAADVALTGGANQLPIWQAFARRGLGSGAATASANSGTVTTSSAVPPGLLDPRVVSVTPAVAEGAPPTSVDLTFSEAMDPASFAVADDVASFTGPGGADLLGQITGTAWSNGNKTLRVTFNPQPAEGLYTLTVGPNILAADDGHAMDQDTDGTPGEAGQDAYAATFRYDAVVLAVTATTPAAGALITAPMTTLELTFSEAFAPSSLAPTDLTLSRGSVTAVTAVNATTARFTLSGLTAEGSVTATLAAGALQDAGGNPNAAFSATYTVDAGPAAFPTSVVVAQSPSGSRIYSGSTTNTIGTVGDLDGFTLAIDDGQQLMATVTPTTTTTVATLKLLDPSGAVLATGTSSAAGKAAMVQSAGPLPAGTYTVVVGFANNATGTYTLGMTLNSAAELEAYGGATNDAVAAAQSLDAAFATAAGGKVANVTGTMATAADADCYAFDLAAGEWLTTAIDVGNGFAVPDLRVYDPSGAVLAIGSSVTTQSASWERWVADLVAPAAGRYTVRVSGVSGVSTQPYVLTAARNVTLDLEGSNSNFSPRPLQAATGGGGSTRYAVGGITSSSDFDYYSVALAAGELLTASTVTPAAGTGAPANTLGVRLRIYNTSSSTPLAEAGSGGPDPRNAAIAYIAPAAGTYVVAAYAPGSGAFAGDYWLTVNGGTPATTAFAVSSSSPSNGGGFKTTGPSTISVTFNEAVLATSVQPSDLTLDGVPATAVTMTSATTASFTVPQVTAAGTHTFAIAAGAVLDLQGSPVTASTRSFVIETVPPRVTATTLASGDVRGTGANTAVVTFDEPIGTNVTTADVTLVGTLRNVAYTPTSVSFNAARTVLTVTLPATLPEDRYVLTLLSGDSAFEDVAGNDLDGEATWPLPAAGSGNGVEGGNFVVDFAVDTLGTPAAPAMAPQDPAGGLVYLAPTLTTAAITGATDADAWAIAVDAGQALSVEVAPTAAGLRPKVEVLDPTGAVVASATAPAAGAAAILQAFAVPAAGNYSVRVGSADGTVGAYALRLAANAAFEAEGGGGPTNDTPATAQNIDGTFLPVAGGTGGTRGAVVGRPPAGTSVTDGFDGGTLGPAWSTYSSAPAGRVAVNATVGVGGTPALQMDTSVAGTYVLNEAVWSVDLTGMAATTLSFAHASYGDELETLPATFTGHANGDGVSISGDGTTWYRVWDPASSTTTWATATIDLAAALQQAGIAAGPSVRVKFQQYDDNPMTTDGRGWDDVAVAGTASAGPDAYAFTLAAGDAVTAAVARQGASGPAPTVRLLDPSGAPLGTEAAVASYVAPAAGTYYAVADAAGAYQLVVARNAALDGGANASLAAAQPVDPALPVLGTISAAAAADFYRFPVAAGSRLVVTTATPGDGSGEPANGLNPAIELYDANNVLVAADDNGAADGRNARVAYTVPAAGHYRVRVSGASSTTGDYVLRVTGADPVAIPGTPALRAASDTGSSAADGVTANNNATPAKALTFDVGQTVPGAIVTLYVGGVPFASAVASGTTVSLTTAGNDVLPDGVYAVTARQALPGQAEGPDSLPAALTIDTAAPARPGAPDLQAASDSGASSTDDVTNVTTPTLAVAASAPHLRVYRDGVLVSGAFATGGAFASAALPEGTYAFTVSAVDAAGNESPQSGAVAVTVDTAGPTATSTPAGVTAAGGTTHDLAVTYTDPNGVDAGSLDGSDVRVEGPNAFQASTALVSVAPAGNGSPLTATYRVSAPGGTWDSADAGTYAVRLQALQVRDVAGNAAPPAATTVGTFAVAAFAPAAPDLASATDSGASTSDNLTNYNNASPALAPRFSVGGVSTGATVTVYADGVAVGSLVAASGTVTVTGSGAAALADGPRSFTARQALPGGPESPDSPALAVTVDTTAPSATAAAADVTAAGGASTTVAVTYADANGINAAALGATDVQVRLNGTGPALAGTFVGVDVAGNGSPRTATYRFTAPGGGWDASDNGTYVVSVAPGEVPDLAGNAAAAAAVAGSFNVAVFAAPAAPDLVAASDTGQSSTDNVTRLNNAAPAAAPQFSVGGVAVGATVTVYADGVAVGSAVAPASTATVVADGATALADGPHQITARQTLPGGTESPESPPLAVTVDATAPASVPAPVLLAGSDTGASNSDGITGAAQLTFQTTVAEPGRLWVGAAALVPVAVTATFAGSRLLVLNSVEGTHQVVAWAEDVAGNRSPDSPPTAVTIDLTAPPAPTVAPDLRADADSGISDADDLTYVTLPTIDAGAGQAYVLVRNGVSQPAVYDGRPYVPSAPLADGTYTFAARQLDLAGNASPAGPTLTVTVDTVPPGVNGGTRDATFGTGGSRIDSLSAANDIIFDVAVQPDGKVVGAGVTSNASAITGLGEGVVTRYAGDGQPDPTFGTNGVVRVQLPGGEVSGFASIAVLPDGKLLATGSGGRGLLLARFNPDGTLDAGFGTAGLARAASATQDYQGNDGIVRPDGRIVVVGRAASKTSNPYTQDHLLAQFRSDGSLDPSFASGGVVTMSMGDSFEEALAVALDSSDRIVIAGHWYTGETSQSSDFVISRFRPDGTLDPTFSPGGTDGDGRASLDLGPQTDFPYDIALRPDGRIVVAGQAGTPVKDGVVVQYTPDGALDPSFGTGGVAKTNLATHDWFYGMAIDESGRVVATGMTTNDLTGGPLTARFTPAGTLDPSFGTGGISLLPLSGGRSSTGRALVVDPLGRYVIAGSAGIATDGDVRDLAVHRLLSGDAPRLDLDAASDTGPSATDDVTTDSTPTFNVGPLAPYYRVFRDGAPVGPLYATGSQATLPEQPAGTWAYTVAPVDAAGNLGSVSLPLSVTITAPTPPPAVAAAAANAGDAQRSRATSVVVTFDRAVVAGPGAFVLGGASAAGATVSAANPSGDGVTWTLTFAAAVGQPPLIGGSLPDGSYDLTVVAAEVRTAAAGTAAGTAMSADYHLAFHRLFGDADGDRDVDGADSRGFRTALGSAPGDPAYNAAFDFDADGDVDGADSRQFRTRLGTSL